MKVVDNNGNVKQITYTGSGTTNTITKWTSSNAIGNSQLTDNGTTISTSGTLDLSSATLQGFYLPYIFGHRLTTLSGTAVTTADRTSQGSLYLTPAQNFGGTTAGSAPLSLYTSSKWKLYTSGEIGPLSLSLTSGNNYDVFLYDNSGTLTLETLIWTDATTRATALDLQDGVLLKHGALTRRYVGTIRASGSNVTEDSAANRFVWNMYNRRARPMKKTSATTSWTYATATWRAANGDSSLALGVLVGVPEDSITVTVSGCIDAVTANAILAVGIGRAGSTTVNSADTWQGVGHGNNAVAVIAPSIATLTEIPSLGYQSYQWLENALDAVSTTLLNDGSNGKSYIYSTVLT